MITSSMYSFTKIANLQGMYLQGFDMMEYIFLFMQNQDLILLVI